MKQNIKEYKYKFSVIIPIYKVEEYLKETIESVINQTIGFKKNIQLILINDGSPDNSEKICMGYKKKYPGNIIYVKQKNQGVSVARNNGMKYIEGKYTNFLDSDDIWDLNAFEKVYAFFEKHYEEIDVVGCRIKFFEGKEGFHALDFTFKPGTRVVDINKEYDSIHIHNATSFLKSEVLDKYKFDTDLKYAEDSKFITTIILDKLKYGLVADTNYNYRNRTNNSSAVQTKKDSISWYTDTIEKNYKFLIDYSKRKHNKVLKYLQYMIMYDIQFRLKEKMPSKFSNIKEYYITELKNILNEIDDSIILEQKKLYGEYKIYALSLKYGKDILEELEYINGMIYYKDMFVQNILKKAINVEVLEIENDNLRLSGFFSTVLNENDYKVYIICNEKKKIQLELFEVKREKKESFNGEIVKKCYGFKMDISIKKIKNIKFVIKFKDDDFNKLNINLKRLSKLNKQIHNSYYSTDKYICYCKKNTLRIRKHTLKGKIKFEAKFIVGLLKAKKIKIILYRFLYYINKLFKKKEIWIVSDRLMSANDNGMHLFKYICRQKNKSIKAYFVINKKSEDYRKIKKIGKVLTDETIKYKIKFLLADKIISSQADDSVFNTFGKNREYFRDLYKYKFVFLQHGIIKDNLSDWLNYFNKNIKFFVTSSKREYEAILKEDYYYDSSVIKLTGLPRYDNLYNETEKQIAIMPTWRKNLSGKMHVETGIRDYNFSFKESDYFKFYNNLINDKRIIEKMQEKGYKGIFVVHPSHLENAIDFNSKCFKVIKEFANYQNIFRKSSLLISDYSSVSFDFGYLEKPVIYTQFDKKDFFEHHTYTQGYFDYEKDGFGPVCYNYETTVKKIIEQIDKGCVIEQKYKKRIENFYAYHDRNNCKRVYEEILKM